MAVIADLPAYPEWAKGVREVEVLEEQDNLPIRVRFTLDAGPVKDVYTLAYTWAGDGLSVEWTLIKGQMQKSQYGRYSLEPLGSDRTKVTYVLSVELALPMIGLLRRKAEKMIMDTALKDLKQRAEGQQ